MASKGTYDPGGRDGRGRLRHEWLNGMSALRNLAGWKKNPAGKLKDDELRISLASKIVKNGRIKVTVIGPEKNGIDIFRKELDALALKDPNLRKCIDWLPISLPLMPQGYTVQTINKFYTELGGKLQKIADSPDKYDVLCLVRGGELKDITHLNNVPLWQATIKNPILVCSALGDNDIVLWPSWWADHEAYSPAGLAHWLQQIVNLALEMLKSRTPTVSSATKTPTKNTGDASMGAKPPVKAPKNAPNVAKPKATATAKPKPTKTAAPKAKPAPSTATKPTKASAAKTATAVTATTQKTPKAVKTAAPKALRKTATKTSKAKTTKASAVVKPEGNPKTSTTKIIVSILLLILVIVAVIAAYLEKFA